MCENQFLGVDVIFPNKEENINRMADEGLELGDYIVILGGSLNKTTGKLYSYSEDRFSILPSGATDRLIKIPLVDGMPDPELGITDIKILKKAPVPGFIHLVDLRAGQMVESFLEGPVRGPFFKVISVNEEADSAVFEDEAGEQTEIVFGYTGIPRELGYEVIRTREIDEQPPVPEGEAQENDAVTMPTEPKRTTLAVAFDEEDVAEEGVVPTPREEQEEGEREEGEREEGEDKTTYEIGEDIELPEIKEIEEVSSAFRVYQDVFQRSEMLGQLIRNLPTSQQRNPVKLQEIRRIVELMLIMRNDVVQYGITGEPLGQPKATSLATLAELVVRDSPALVRKVANVSKVLYLDHSYEHKVAVYNGTADTDPEPGKIEEGLYVEYERDIIDLAETLQKTASMGEGGGEPGPGMPKFFVDLETYRKKIQAPYQFSIGKEKTTQDEEVFRLEIPSTTMEDANLNVLSQGVYTYPPVVIQSPFGIARMLKQRVSRFTTGEQFRVVEQGENPNYNTVLVFPKSTLREVGPIRSGILAQDVSLGMTEPRLLQDIINTIEDISDQPTADGILSLGVDGGTVGNIMVKDWLSSLDLNISGVGDTLHLLRGYGALSIEWNKEQMAVLQYKIEQRLAALRIFLTKQREENKATLANLKFEPKPLLAPELSARILDRIRGEPILQKAAALLNDYMGELGDIDVYWFTFLFVTYPDLLFATLGQQPAMVAKERIKQVRQHYNNALHLGYRIKMKMANAGEIPVVNTCPHVEALENARKLGHKYADEPRDTTKTKALLKVLNRFRGKVEDNWVWCNRCSQHLMCGHELLQVQEILRPREKDAIQKEIILKFSGGEFSGKFICRVCGQGIRELDFDTNVEFDDAGRPMMGRAVLVDQDAIEEEEINALLSGPSAEESLEFPSEDLTQIYKTVKKICSLIGVNPEDNDYRNMVSEISNYTSGLATREVYSAAAKGKKVQDYDIWYSVRYVSASAAVVLLNIQTHIPDYIVYYTNADCKDGFFGYPLEQEVEESSGLNCITNIIAGINDNEFPWNLTTLQASGSLQKRKEALMPLIKSQIEAFLKYPSVQAILTKKRDYRMKLYGSKTGVKRDNIASNFRPVPYMLTAEEAAEAPVVPDAASDEKRATAWIRMAHSVASASAALNPDSPYSETTSCLHSIGTPKSTEWDKLPRLEARVSGITGRSSTLATTFYTEKERSLEGKIDPSDYYKLFVKLCHQGPKKGLPHELGITLTCTNCELTFQENPSLITEYDSKDKEEYQLRTKAYLESQGIVINESTFNELLMTSRQKEAVAVDEAPYLAGMSDVFERMIQYPAALDGWEELIRKTQMALNELSAEGLVLSRVQIATASEELVRHVVEREDFVKSRLNKQVYGFLQSIIARHPRECGEALSTYLLVPFQRWIMQVNVSDYTILKSYLLSKGTVDDIMIKGLGTHLEIIGGEKLVGIALLKAKAFVNDLSIMCRNIFPYIRAVRTPGGKDMIQYLSRAYIIGAISKLIDPQQIPVIAGEIPEGDAINMKLIYKALGQTLTKYAISSKIPSEEEIRISLEKRAEKEKQVYLSKLEGMSKESRQVERVLMGFGMGDWAVGGSKAIRQYDADRYEAERAERAAAGIMDYPGLAEANAADNAHTYDMFGEVYNDAGAGDGGYDHDQMAEDDY